MSQHIHTMHPASQEAYRSAVHNTSFIRCDECGATPQIILVWPEQIHVVVNVDKKQERIDPHIVKDVLP